ncbi:MAG TPA: hypothetical protein VG013_30780 [Gemmataceae bacterium]|jgi:hypothetical protein|nr:hypothetical protein [Gemmataceae bacterium]
MLLGTLSAVSGFLSLCLIPGLIAVTLGLAVCIMASRDFRKMEAGMMDRVGWDRTWRAEGRGFIALMLGLGGLTLWAIGFLALAMSDWW